MATVLERGIQRCRGITPTVADILLTIAVTVLSLSGLFGPHEQTHAQVSWQAIALTLLATLPLVARRRQPFAVLAVVGVAGALFLATAPLNGPQSGLGVAVALYTVATCTDRRTSLRIAGLIAGVNALVLLIGMALGRPETGPSLFVVSALVVGG